MSRQLLEMRIGTWGHGGHSDKFMFFSMQVGQWTCPRVPLQTLLLIDELSRLNSYKKLLIIKPHNQLMVLFGWGKRHNMAKLVFLLMRGVSSLKFVREVANSDVLTGIIDIPAELKNKTVEIIVLPYDTEKEDKEKQQVNKARGILENYKNERLKDKENEAWGETAVERYENS